MKVYAWPACLGGETLYGDPWRLRSTTQWDGAPGQITEIAQRARIELGGEVVRPQAHILDIMLARLEGGRNLVGVWDAEMRLQAGWDSALAGQGDAELWHAQGRTALYGGESEGGDWRSVLVTGSGSAGSTSLTVSGLLSGEAIPAGTWVRVGEYRYRVAQDAAESSGGAVLTLATPLILAPDGDVRLPGDYCVCRLVGVPEVSRADSDGVRTFTVRLVEVYADEVEDGFEYVS